MTERPHVLIADDEERARTILELNLRDRYDIHAAGTGREALRILETEPVHIVVSDLRMPDGDGVWLLGQVRESHPDVPFIMMTAYGTVESAVEAMKQGAFDYILKPIKIDEVEVALEKALAHANLLRENRELRETIRRIGGMPEIITVDDRMRDVLQKVKQVAPTTATVLITGESGTGKELVAQAVYRLSARADRLLVDINCAAIPRELLESELFGHEKGAFTGAVALKRGRFEQADRGTLFLDEVGELPMDLQVKLLRVLETGRFTRVGGTKAIESDFRVMAATNRNLREAVREGAFRADLYYRLNVVTIDLPPLRERSEDIPLLVRRFIEKHERDLGRRIESVELRTVDLLRRYDWPGNVRELENVVLQAMVLAEDGVLRPEHLPAEIRALAEARESIETPITKDELAVARSRAGDEIERRFLVAALRRSAGNVTRAAEETGFSRRNLQILMRKHGLDEGMTEEE